MRTSIAVTQDDRCLNDMPMFHIHGLIAAVSGSLAAGGQIMYTPGFNALCLFAQLDDTRLSR